MKRTTRVRAQLKTLELEPPPAVNGSVKYSKFKSFEILITFEIRSNCFLPPFEVGSKSRTKMKTIKSINNSNAFIHSSAPIILTTGNKEKQTTSLSKRLQRSLTLCCLGIPHLQPSSTKITNALLSTYPSILSHPPYPLISDSPIVVWFHSTDLRLEDNPALTCAIAENRPILPVYILNSNDFGKTEFGFEKTGRHRAKFLLNSIHSLRTSLRNLSSDLIIRTSDNPSKSISEICHSVNCKTIYTHHQIDDSQDDSDWFRRYDIKVMRKWCNTLYDINDLPFNNNRSLPDVYTIFRQKINEHSIRIKSPTTFDPKQFPSLPTHKQLLCGHMPTLQSLGLSQIQEEECVVKGGEQQAILQVNQFIDSLNNDSSIGIGTDFSCRMSPWLSVGCVSPRWMYKQMESQCTNSENGKATVLATYYELLWRDYFRFITYKSNSNMKRGVTKQKRNDNKTSSPTFSRSLVGIN